jgi:flagellar hook-associated protein 2
MTSGTGSISVSGLLGGTAGQIDVTSLISQLMQAAQLPQKQLQDQLTSETSQLNAYQAINTRLTSMFTAAQKLTDATTWSATSATASDSSVAASSDSTAILGTTSFSVVQTAKAEVATVTADASGNVVTTPSSGITINGTNISLASGSASDVASAINAANVGVTANVVTTSSGQTLLQMTSSKTGAANVFTTSGFSSTPQTVVAAQDAQIAVGDPSTTGYTVNSSSNTFSNVIQGVTFTVSAPASNVSITVGKDEQSISGAVKALVDSANAATTEMNTDTAQGAALATNPTISSIGQSVLYSVSNGTSTGASLSTYGISIDKNGVMSFDATAFASAYGSDPAGTQKAITDFANSLQSTADLATNATYGSVTSEIQSVTTISQHLTSEIGDWNDRLTTIKNGYTAKFTAMEAALAKLQSQQTYLTSMFNKMSGGSSSSSSGG